MAVEIGRTGEYGHNNSARAFVDSDFVRGGGREVADLSALYGLTTKSDQLKENVTIVWVDSEAAFYVLTDYTNIGNSNGWTDLSTIVGGSVTEVNDLTAAVIWANVPNANITESSVTQHQAALAIAQSQVANLTSDLASLQLQITSNDGDITSLQNELNTTQAGAGLAVNGVYAPSQSSNYINSATTLFGADILLDTQIKSNANSITTINTTISGLDTDDIPESTTPTNLYYTDARFDTRFSAKSTDDLSQGSSNLYNVQADWNATTGSSEILNKPISFPPSSHSHAIGDISGLQNALDGKIDDAQVLTNVPANAVFTDTTYSIQDGELSENNLSNALKSTYDGYASQISAKQDALTFGIADTNAVDIDSPSATISSGQYARFTANGLEGRSAANVLGDIGAASFVQLSAVSQSVTTNTANIASNLSAIQSNDTDIANNATAISNEATARTNADTALQVQITTNINDIATNTTAIAANTTHSGITSGNPHGTSITNLLGVPGALGSYKNVLTVNQAGNALEYSDLIEEITNEVLDLVNSSSSYTLGSADLNGDGIVGTADLLILLSQYGNSVQTPFTAAWRLDDSNSTIPYTGSANESSDNGNPTDSNTNLLLIETPVNVSAYTPWTITTNTNNETVTISQSNNDSAAEVEYSKKLDFIVPIEFEVQQTSDTSNVYWGFLKAVYSYPTANDVTIWHALGNFTHLTANYDPSASGATQTLAPQPILNLFDYTSAGTSGDEHPNSVTMSFRYMKSAEAGDGYVRLKYVDFKWIS